MDLDHSQTVQASVIGSLLLEPGKLCGEIFRELRSDDFTDSALRNLFEAAKALWLEQTPVDAVTLRDRAGAAYEPLIRAALEVTPTAANWRSYCQIVKNEAQLSRLRGVAFQVLECEKAEEARALLLEAQGMLAQSASIRVTRLQDMAADFLNRMEDRKPPVFLDFGFPALNEHVTITKGRFVVLAAESSVGKTALALQMALGLARGGQRVGFFSLETSAPDAADRIFANAGDVALPEIKHRRLTPEGIRRCIAEARGMIGVGFDLIEAPGCRVEDVRALTLSGRYDAIFVDYVQLLSAKGNSPQEQVRAISIALHTLALDLGVTVVGLSQVTPPDKNKNGERPELSKENLRESHQLIHDGEAILILDLTDRRDYQSPRILKVDKNKDGPCCRLTLAFDGRHMRFTYLPPYEDDAARAARERNEKMDANRKARQEKEWRKAHPEIEGQVDFTQTEEAVPFEDRG